MTHPMFLDGDENCASVTLFSMYDGDAATERVGDDVGVDVDVLVGVERLVAVLVVRRAEARRVELLGVHAATPATATRASATATNRLPPGVNTCLSIGELPSPQPLTSADRLAVSIILTPRRTGTIPRTRQQ